MSYFIAIDSTLGPFNTLAEAEFAADAQLKAHPFNESGRPRKAQILQLVRTVDPEPTRFKLGPRVP